MDTIFMNSGNSKTFDPQRPLVNLSDKINLNRSDKNVVLSNLSIYDSWKNIKKFISLKHQLRHEMKTLNYLMNHIQYQVF